MDEGTYLYPLPGEAVFNDFSLWEGDRELKGETMDAAQARAIYEAIVRRKRDPALIELAGRGLLRARVFPINPGETRKITLRYTQLLDRIGDAWRFRFTRDRVSVPRSFHVGIDSAAGFGDPYSPTHRLSASRSGDHIDVTLADSSAGGDLELLLPLTRPVVGVSVATHHVPGEADGYFMALLTPGQAGEARGLRRDLVAVLDISGSMSGEKLDQAKAALVQLLGTLHANDRFRLIAFSSAVRPEAAGWTDATAPNVARATQWVRGLTAEGGTNIAGALGEAFADAPGEGALGVVVFLTDGLPTVGDTDPERIAAQAEQARGGFRVFSFGLGYDVNTFLLDRLTERARGVTEYVAPGTDIESAVGLLAAKIASPVMTDVALSADGAELYDLQPARLPDLFAGEELVVFGRFREGEHGAWGMTVAGRRGGRMERFATTVSGAEQGGREYVTQLWAARKAGALTREIRLHGPTPEVMTSLKDLALRYGILTEYTAYLVQEPGVVAQQRLEDRMPPMAAAPAQQFGAQSVARAKAEAKSAAAANATDAMEADLAARADPRAAQTKRAGGRLFAWRDSAWTDIGHRASLPVVQVAPFSDAYFALLAALPELAQPAALEPAVLVAGRRVSVMITAAGRTDWRPGELERVVTEFRS
jgi:Ca-activated chloride channel family protein